jgi:hypothetical protein
MKKELLIYFFIVSLNSFTQTKSDLLNHLFKNKLFREYEYVLKYDTVGINQDSLAYFKILNHLNLKQNTEIIKNFEFADKLIVSDTNFYLKLNMHFLQLNDSTKRVWFNNKLKHLEDTLSKQFKNLAKILLNEKFVDTNLIAAELREYFKEYVKYRSKKPIISSFYSAIIPGLGKLYNGRKYSFKNVFSAHILLGSKFVESVYVLGIYNPYTFITFGFLSTYYLANIVGSYFDLVEVKKEKQLEFIFNVQNYYLQSSAY